jgi:hypothetical protein
MTWNTKRAGLLLPADRQVFFLARFLRLNFPKPENSASWGVQSAQLMLQATEEARLRPV